MLLQQFLIMKLKSMRKVAKCSLGLVYNPAASLEIILQSSASHRVGQRPTCVPLHLEVDTWKSKFSHQTIRV